MQSLKHSEYSDLTLLLFFPQPYALFRTLSGTVAHAIFTSCNFKLELSFSLVVFF